MMTIHWSLECSLKFASSPGLLELGIQASMAGRGEKAGTTPALACSAAAPATVLSHLPSPNDHHPYPLKQRRVVQIYPMPQPAISNGFSNGSSNMVDSWAPTLEPCCAGHGN